MSSLLSLPYCVFCSTKLVKAKQVLPGSEGIGRKREGQWGEMAQNMCSHMNKWIKNKERDFHLGMVTSLVGGAIQLPVEVSDPWDTDYYGKSRQNHSSLRFLSFDHLLYLRTLETSSRNEGVVHAFPCLCKHFLHRFLSFDHLLYLRTLETSSRNEGVVHAFLCLCKHWWSTCDVHINQAVQWLAVGVTWGWLLNSMCCHSIKGKDIHSYCQTDKTEGSPRHLTCLTRCTTRSS
jgi:hypothetical protein